MLPVRWRWWHWLGGIGARAAGVVADYRQRSHDHDHDQFVDLTETTRRQALRDAEWQRGLDEQSRVVRTMRSARAGQATKRAIPGIVERRRERV